MELSLFHLLAEEHKLIESMLDHPPGPEANLEEWRRYIGLCEKIIEGIHHTKEEQILFAAVRPLARLKGGGPMCTFFFEGHICSSSMSMAQAIVSKYPDFKIPLPFSPLLAEDQKKGIPLTIPGEDHESGRILLHFCQYVISSEQISLPQKYDLIQSTFAVYRKIQKRHFEREENCFFKMCRELLDEKLVKELTEKMQRDFVTLSSGHMATS